MLENALYLAGAYFVVWIIVTYFRKRGRTL